MASEPDDYQTISDNCPGYMVLISEGIVCTRCAGEKRHKTNDCPKPTTAADLVTETGFGLDHNGTDNADSGMESLSDTDSVSSESTVRSGGSEMQVTNAHRSDQGGSHPQSTHPPRRGFARRSDGSCIDTEPDRTSPLPSNFIQTGGQASNTATSKQQSQSRYSRDLKQDSNSLTSANNVSVRCGTTTATKPSPTKENSSLEQGNDKKRRGSHSQHKDRLSARSLADTTGKFDYSNTTCPSSFGFGRLPSESMG